MNPNLHFPNGEDGIHLLKEENHLIQLLKDTLGKFNRGTRLSFAVIHHEPMTLDRIQKINAKSHVVSPKPLGDRYLLYKDSKGKIFLENKAQDFFQLDADLALQFVPVDTILEGIMVKRKAFREGSNRHTFFIMDATRCHGMDLTQKGIIERISIVKAKIIEPSLNILLHEQEVFEMDIAKYEPPCRMQQLLSESFKEAFKYPLASFVFHPIDGEYCCAKLGDPVLEWVESRNPESCFRLKFADGGGSTADLMAIGRKPQSVDELKCAQIDLTDELRSMNGSIIECHYDYVDLKLTFSRVRADLERPNVKYVPDYDYLISKPLPRRILLAQLLASRDFERVVPRTLPLPGPSLGELTLGPARSLRTTGKIFTPVPRIRRKGV